MQIKFSTHDDFGMLDACRFLEEKLICLDNLKIETKEIRVKDDNN